MINVAINGYGRIGRNVLRAFYERPELRQSMKLVAINDLGSPEMNAHLTQFDTTHGRFTHPVSAEGDDMVVGSDRIRILAGDRVNVEMTPYDLTKGRITFRFK